MEFLSDEVSVKEEGDRLSVVISQRLHGWKRTALILWTVLWFLCGLAFIAALIQAGDKQQQLMIAVMLAFWAYYAWRIGKATLWRLKGFELWRVKDGLLTIKYSTYSAGKASEFHTDNISELGVLNIDKTSWKWQFGSSFWQMGGERLGFMYQGRKILFGRGLNDKEAKRLVKVLGKRVTSRKKIADSR